MKKRYVFGSLTRTSDLEHHPFEVEKIMDKELWDTGDYVVGKYVCPKHRHTYSGDFCELPSGRHRYYLPGDQVVGVLGDRNATQELCGEWKYIEHPDPDGGPTLMDDIDGAGLFGKMTSISSRFKRQGKFEYMGHVVRDGKKVCMEDFCAKFIPSLEHPPMVPTILIVGTAMSCGKSCTARVAIRCLKEMGIHTVVGAKLTGAGYLDDILGFEDAGADSVVDFVDVGLPSTVVPQDEYRIKLHQLFGLMESRYPDVLVVEAGASPCENYNGHLVLEAYASHPSLIFILCASDVYSVMGAKQYLEEYGLGIQPDLVSGIISNTAAGRDLVEKTSGIPAFSLNTDESIEDFARMVSSRLGVP